ncbi:lantibiotic dehydratase [Nonomuraea sp. NPDC049141]|uniref:lantibiotic dehydratase n=1 Tax=Nonomuraea sp. NPDC049141 TaxID=3155500 RepID=UPI0033F1748C
MILRRPLYRPLDWLVVRTPLLPVEDYLALGEGPPDCVRGTALPADARIRRALLVGGGDLPRALARSFKDDRAGRKSARKLRRYLTRMSTRPTPYGLFAGVGLGAWGERTGLTLTADQPRIHTRPDMEWLLSLVTELERRAEVRTGLRWFANPAAFVQAGRVRLGERAPSGDGAAGSVSLRATAPVLRALKVARAPVPYQWLFDELTGGSAATADKVARLLEQLWAHGVLLTDLRPPLTGGDPARQVARRLAELPATHTEAKSLDHLLAAMSRWDRLPPEAGADRFADLVEQAESVHPAAPGQARLQSDMALPLGGRTVHRRVAVEVARAAELMLRLSPMPRGAAALDSYRRAFEARYGKKTEVPLLELLDPEIGLGPPEYSQGSGTATANRHQILLNLALEAIRDGRRVVDLDEAALTALETWEPSPSAAPTSLDISVFVLAASPSAVDDGDFSLVIGPNQGGGAAGRTLGRFAHLIGHDAVAALASAARAEAAVRPGRLWAEVDYQPRRARSGNVTIRPLVRDHAIVLDAVPTAPGRAVPVDELFVGVRDGRFVVRWPALDREVTACAGHMLTGRQAPAVVRFLDEVACAGQPRLGGFGWGPAAQFPFLPRVRVGRVILTPAIWRVPSMPPGLFAAWREQWRLPRYVYLTFSDNRLLLDLADPAQLDEVHHELGLLPKGGTLILHEALPAPEDAWLPGADGHYISELLVPVVLDHEQPPPPDTVRRAVPVTRSVQATDRVRPPGSDWLYVKLYHAPESADELIAGPVREFGATVRADGLADEWFFLRYADPEPHLRFRLRGDPDALATVLAPRLFRWATSLIDAGRCGRFCVDTYDREVERYGGPDGLAVAETLFAVDSEAVADLLNLDPGLDRTLTAARTVDDLLAAMGLDEAGRATWYRERAPDGRTTGTAYRKRQTDLRSALGDPAWPSAQPAGPELEQLLRDRAAGIRSVTRRLDDLDARGALWVPKAHLMSSFVHMHCNRLLPGGPASEQRLLGLLSRTRESLLRAPLRTDHV